MNKNIKRTLIVVGIGFLLIAGCNTFLYFAFPVLNGEYYSKNDLIENYNSKTKQIAELTIYIKSITPGDINVYIEFDGNNTLAIFDVDSDGIFNSNRDIKVNSLKTDTLLRKIGWTREILSTLKKKLDNANCISVASREPCAIGFRRSGMGEYFYKVFNQPLNDSLKNKFNDGCTHVFYKDNIVLGYYGGALGPQCFEDFKYKGR